MGTKKHEKERASHMREEDTKAKELMKSPVEEKWWSVHGSMKMYVEGKETTTDAEKVRPSSYMGDDNIKFHDKSLCSPSRTSTIDERNMKRFIVRKSDAIHRWKWIQHD